MLTAVSAALLGVALLLNVGPANGLASDSRRDTPGKENDRRPAGPTLKSLELPGAPAFVRTAKGILDVRFSMDPSLASQAGLFDDAARAPSFSSRTVVALSSELKRDLKALRAMPWRSWEVDRQLDWRWLYALAEDALRQLETERLYLRRPASWLEPLANDYIYLLTFAPERVDLRQALTRLIPAMVAEMREVVRRPTARDVKIADGVSQGLLTLLASEPAEPERDAASLALSSYMEGLKALQGLPEFAVIGRENYEWRLKRALLLPWSAQGLLSIAQRELAEVDLALADLKPLLSTSAPTAQEEALARDLTQASLLGLYDDISREYREFLDRANVLTLPAGVIGPIKTRPTPEAMIPLTGDGGSMNPPPPIGTTNVGWWNVEHFKPEWTQAKRLEMVLNAVRHKRTDMGPYAVHEGVPGHHLQLSLARLNPNPLRSLLYDNPMVEGWALYAEELFWTAGGFGPSAEAQFQMLDSWRYRVRRVFYDVHVECGDWTLQHAADFKHRARRGRGEPDEDILRAINWPAQLIGYFAGKMQLLELREAYRNKLGTAYTDRKFHDAVLAEGSIPLALIRAKLLGEPIPGI